VDEISGIASGKSTVAEHIVISMTFLGAQISNNQNGANLGMFVNWCKSCRAFALHTPRLVLYNSLKIWTTTELPILGINVQDVNMYIAHP